MTTTNEGDGMETIREKKVVLLGYTLDDVAVSLSLSKPMVYKLLTIEDFPKISIGRKYVIPVRELEDWLTSHVGDAYFTKLDERNEE